MCNINHVFSVCPTGYEANDGDVNHGGLTGGYSASLEKCKTDCDAKSECHSFVHSISGNQCKLLAEAEPTHPKDQDGQFCKMILIGTCVYEWHAWILLYHLLFIRYCNQCHISINIRSCIFN